MDLSIIIPAYNVESYLAECVDSLLSNMANRTIFRFEIIIVNDGSTDSTYEIALQYSEKYNFIRVLNKKNGGLSDARNVGIENAEGSYLSFIDSDDIVKDGFIDDILNVIDANNSVDIISFDIHKFFKHPDFSDKIFQYDYVEKEFYCSKSLVTCNKIYRSDLFNEIRFPLGKYYEDVWTIPSIIISSSKFIHIRNDYYGYRQRQGSITSNIDSKYMDIIGALDVICHEIDSPFIRNVMVSQFFTLMFLSLRLPVNEASKNINTIFDFFEPLHDVWPSNNVFFEKIAYTLYFLLRKKSKFIFLLCRPVVALHLYIKNHRG